MKYVADSFQLFFPCDYGLQSYLFKNNLKPSVNVRGSQRSSIPIIYADQTKSTIKKDIHLRKYAYPSALFNQPSSSLNWVESKKGIQIPSENFLVDITDNADNIKITADTTSDYHIEFAYNRSTNMGMWENWFAIYFPLQTAVELVRDIGMKVDKSKLICHLKHEKKQTTGKREDFHYTSMPVEYYQFTYESFTYAKQLLEKNGFDASYKGLVYEGKDLDCFKPKMKIGYVHTKESDGDFNRNPQICIKLTQSGVHNGTKFRGRLLALDNTENFVLVNKKKFVYSILSVLYLLNKGGV